VALTDIKRPVGTVEELQKDGVDPAIVPTCSLPVVNAQGETIVVGCPWAKALDENGMPRCNLSIKFKSGPRMFAVAEFKGEKNGGGTLVNERDCQWIAQHKETVEAQGGVLRIVAGEGDEYETYTSVREDDKNPLSTRVYKNVTKVVQPYHRLEKNQDYAEYLQRNKARRIWNQQRSVERETAILGGTDEQSQPLDAGLAGGGKGSGSKK